jgi:hypothetical protein
MNVCITNSEVEAISCVNTVMGVTVDEMAVWYLTEYKKCQALTIIANAQARVIDNYKKKEKQT